MMLTQNPVFPGMTAPNDAASVLNMPPLPFYDFLECYRESTDHTIRR